MAGVLAAAAGLPPLPRPRPRPHPRRHPPGLAPLQQARSPDSLIRWVLVFVISESDLNLVCAVADGGSESEQEQQQKDEVELVPNWEELSTKL